MGMRGQDFFADGATATTLLLMALVWCATALWCATATASVGPENAYSNVYWDDEFTLPMISNGNVNAMVADSSGNIYIGGGFTAVGDDATQHVAVWNAGTSTWYTLGTGTDGNVSALTIDSHDNLYAAGTFATAGGVTVGHIAKWDGAAWSALGTGIGGPYPFVYALTADNAGNVYAGGAFTEAGDVPANYIAKWDGTAWSALGTGLNGLVEALAVDSVGNLYVGGDFTQAGSVPVNGIAKWDGTKWSALGMGIRANSVVDALALDAAGHLYASASYMGVGGIPAVTVAEWINNQWSELGTATASNIFALATDLSGHLYVGGAFGTAFGISANDVAVWDGKAWSAMGSGMTGTEPYVYALTVDGAGNVFAGGGFTTAGGVMTPHAAKWNGSYWSPLTITGTDGAVLALAPDGAGNVYAGGAFSTVGTLFSNSADVVANHVAKWNGTSWTALDGGVNDKVYAVVSDGHGGLYAGGDFTKAGGLAARHVAKWNGAAWSPLGAGTDNTVTALAVDSSGNLYAGGNFVHAGGVTANFVAKWDGAKWSPMGAGMNGTVNALVAANTVYAGGIFTTADGITANSVAQWNGSTWSFLGKWNGGGWVHDVAGVSGPHCTVRALAVGEDGAVYAGGWFNQAGDVAAHNVAKWSRFYRWEGAWVKHIEWSTGSLGTGAAGTYSAPNSWFDDHDVEHPIFDNPLLWSLGSGVGGTVYTMARDNTAGLMFIGGDFTAVSGVTVNHAARWDGLTWGAMGSGLSDTVSALAEDRNTLFTGGMFTSAGGKRSLNFAEWQPRVNQSHASFSATPGAITLGNDVYGFYKPALTTTVGTTVSSSGSLPATVALNRADAITINGKRVHGAFTLGGGALQFGGDRASLYLEFSEDDVALFATPYSKFRAITMTYPVDYSTNMEADTATPASDAVPALARVENGKKIYGVTMPLTTGGGTYGVIPAFTVTVTILPTGSGTVTFAPNQERYVIGRTVTLTAIPKTGFEFASWSNNVSDTANPVKVTVNIHKDITANFKRISPPLVITQQPVSGIVQIGNPFVMQILTSGGAGDIHYQWKKDGVDIPNSDVDTYIIHAATYQDAGVYSCDVSDDYDTVSSEGARLTVVLQLPVASRCAALVVCCLAMALCGIRLMKRHARSH